MELMCPSCSAVERCGYTQMLTRLQSVGVMRRSKNPEPMLVEELFKTTAHRFVCSHCQHSGLSVREAQDDDWNDADSGGWGEAVVCQNCRQTIPRERLELLPAAKLCAACQEKEDAGASDQPEYCPRCGEAMSIRLQRGTSRYVMSCPNCGSR